MQCPVGCRLPACCPPPPPPPPPQKRGGVLLLHPAANHRGTRGFDLTLVAGTSAPFGPSVCVASRWRSKQASWESTI